MKLQPGMRIRVSRHTHSAYLRGATGVLIARTPLGLWSAAIDGRDDISIVSESDIYRIYESTEHLTDAELKIALENIAKDSGISNLDQTIAEAILREYETELAKALVGRVWDERPHVRNI